MANTLHEFFGRLKSIYNWSECWYDQEKAAFLLDVPVETFIDYCSTGQLEARWIDQPDGGRDWYVFEHELVRWLEDGPRATMAFVDAKPLMDENRAVRCVAWNDLFHITAAWVAVEGELSAEELGLVDQYCGEMYINFFDNVTGHVFVLSEEDRTALDWIEHDSFTITHPANYKDRVPS